MQFAIEKSIKRLNVISVRKLLLLLLIRLSIWRRGQHISSFVTSYRICRRRALFVAPSKRASGRSFGGQRRSWREKDCRSSSCRVISHRGGHFCHGPLTRSARHKHEERILISKMASILSQSVPTVVGWQSIGEQSDCRRRREGDDDSHPTSLQLSLSSSRLAVINRSQSLPM